MSSRPPVVLVCNDVCGHKRHALRRRRIAPCRTPQKTCLNVVDNLGADTAEAVGHVGHGHEGVQVLRGVLVVVALAGDLHADAAGHVADALGPDVLVELDVNAHVGGLHHLASELLHRSHRLGGPLLEVDAVQRLAEVDGVLASHDILRLTHGCRGQRATKRAMGAAETGVAEVEVDDEEELVWTKVGVFPARKKIPLVPPPPPPTS
mmetsp:Transcript_2761/g.6195  ORF Transcript_2761/g.6195 Transcript_2761/m.6195 type:complete len:207 (-) Transcript_2761:50-670(-)